MIRRSVYTIALSLILSGAASLAQETSYDSKSPAKAEPMAAEWKLIADGLNFPEGPAWNGDDTLCFSNCLGGHVSRVDPAGYKVILGAEDQNDIHERTNGAVFGADGFLYACEYGKNLGGILRIDPKTGHAEVYAKGPEGVTLNRPNDLAFAPDGDLYFTDPSSYDKNKPDGVVYKVDAETGATSVAASGFCFCNGLAFSEDGKNVYLAESARTRVLKFDVAEDGTLVNQSVFIDMPGGDPDGMNFDVEGNLYIAHFGGGAVWVVRPDGSVLKKIETPGKKPSNVDFGGADLKTLYVTEDETNGVYSMPNDIAGLPLFWHPSRK